ncbi:ACT domain-containing protein [Sphingomonas jaspsi]|uniref:ACT domain-containing protein n=1 Tax=Sphingomonas jaspsi TaxID=392409 RepID=UPI0004B018BC|nr:ACT domain-containing protein [Sphingomonas jaspsi]
MTERIEIGFAPGEGAVMRMLGVVERRGFAVNGIAMSADADHGTLAFDVAPRDPSRCLDTVARQLGRLVDVRSVAITSKQPGN